MLKQAQGEKRNPTYRVAKIRIIPDFFSKTMQAKREWSEIYKLLREKYHQLRILYPVKLAFKTEGKINFLRQKLRISCDKP